MKEEKDRKPLIKNFEIFQDSQFIQDKPTQLQGKRIISASKNFQFNQKQSQSPYQVDKLSKKINVISQSKQILIKDFSFQQKQDQKKVINQYITIPSSPIISTQLLAFNDLNIEENQYQSLKQSGLSSQSQSAINRRLVKSVQDKTPLTTRFELGGGGSRGTNQNSIQLNEQQLNVQLNRISGIQQSGQKSQILRKVIEGKQKINQQKSLDGANLLYLLQKFKNFNNDGGGVGEEYAMGVPKKKKMLIYAIKILTQIQNSDSKFGEQMQGVLDILNYYLFNDQLESKLFQNYELETFRESYQEKCLEITKLNQRIENLLTQNFQLEKQIQQLNENLKKQETFYSNDMVDKFKRMADEIIKLDKQNKSFNKVYDELNSKIKQCQLENKKIQQENELYERNNSIYIEFLNQICSKVHFINKVYDRTEPEKNLKFLKSLKFKEVITIVKKSKINDISNDSSMDEYLIEDTLDL